MQYYKFFLYSYWRNTFLITLLELYHSHHGITYREKLGLFFPQLHLIFLGIEGGISSINDTIHFSADNFNWISLSKPTDNQDEQLLFCPKVLLWLRCHINYLRWIMYSGNNTKPISQWLIHISHRECSIFLNTDI